MRFSDNGDKRFNQRLHLLEQFRTLRALNFN